MSDLGRPAVTIIDLGAANIGSVSRMLSAAGARPNCVRSAAAVGAHPIILPGVGHFSAGARAIDDQGLRPKLLEHHLAARPILGICLGAQLLCQRSEEGDGAGLGIVPASVHRFPRATTQGAPLAVPNVGWRAFSPPPEVLPFQVQPGRMYFTHSYYMSASEPGCTPCTAEYGGHRFATVVASGNSLGVQFHPEKSHRYGISFLAAWLRWASSIAP